MVELSSRCLSDVCSLVDDLKSTTKSYGGRLSANEPIFASLIFPFGAYGGASSGVDYGSAV